MIEISDDSTMLAGGFDDSAIRIWSLTPKKLRTLKTPFELARIDKEAGKLCHKQPYKQLAEIKVTFFE